MKGMLLKDIFLLKELKKMVFLFAAVSIMMLIGGGNEAIVLGYFNVLMLSYEPIWAIGTGKTATSDQAEEICAAIRECLAEVYADATAAAIRIQYGGSMNAGNAAELLAKPDIDGGLVGGASLKAEFGKIVNYNK